MDRLISYEFPPTWFDGFGCTAALTGIAKVPPNDGDTTPVKPSCKRLINKSLMANFVFLPTAYLLCAGRWLFYWITAIKLLNIARRVLDLFLAKMSASLRFFFLAQHSASFGLASAVGGLKVRFHKIKTNPVSYPIISLTLHCVHVCTSGHTSLRGRWVVSWLDWMHSFVSQPESCSVGMQTFLHLHFGGTLLGVGGSDGDCGTTETIRKYKWGTKYN